MSKTEDKLSIIARYQVRNKFSPSEKIFLKLLSPLGSFLYFLLAKILGWLRILKIRKVVRMHNAEVPADWSLLNNEIEKPLAIPYCMVMAPRWNTHALISTGGPMNLSGDLKFDTEVLNNCAKIWCLALYKIEDKSVAALVSSTELTGSESEVTLNLEPALYTVSLRLYETEEFVTLPKVMSGDRTVLDSLHVESKPVIDKLKKSVFNKSSFLYYLLHVPVLHRFASGKEIDKLTKNYLPVGNPETLYVYSLLKDEHVVSVSIPDAFVGKCLVFATIYNSSSFPVASQQLYCGQDNSLEFVCEVGSILLRVIPLKGLASDNEHLLDSIVIQSKD